MILYAVIEREYDECEKNWYKYCIGVFTSQEKADKAIENEKKKLEKCFNKYTFANAHLENFMFETKAIKANEIIDAI